MNTVYIRSDKVVKELYQGTSGLNLDSEYLLAMVDGKRTDADIAKILNSDHVIDMLADLEKLGFLISQNSFIKPSIPSQNHIQQVSSFQDALSKEHVLFIKIFLIEEAKLQLGLLSFGIVQQISMVRNADELKSSIGVWHMAIRDSRNGGTIADKLMERLTHLMANPPQKLASEHAS